MQQQVTAPEPIEELTDDTVQRFVDANRLAVVKVYAQWCSFCRAFASTYEDAARELRDDVAFGRIDADFHPAYVERHGVRSLPTLLLYKDGELVETLVGFVRPPALRAALRALQEA